jgi:hypothetical protein
MGEAPEGLEASGEVVGVDEVLQVRSQPVMGVVEVAFDGRVFDGAVHSFDRSGRRRIPRRAPKRALEPPGRP